MNLRHIVPAILISMLLAGCSGLHHRAANNTLLVAQDIGANGGRAVSLKILQQKLNAGVSGPEHENLMLLCGLRRIDAVVSDPKNDDLLLVGSTQGACPVHLDDFVVALRCAFNLYAQRKGSTFYITPPAVSIDPDPRVMAELDRVMAQNAPGQSGRLAAYQQIAASPQDVRVLGMPDCRAASVAIDCDYYLKRLSNGSVKAPGLESLFDLRAKPEREHPFSANITPSQHSMDRFWFKGGKAHFVEDSGVVELQSAPVLLLTESEFLAHGRIGGTGRADKLAEEWVSQFTSRFDEIAANDVRYADLAGIYRTFAIAGLLHSRAEQFSAERILAYLLNDFAVPTANVPRTLPGISRVEEASPERATAAGKEVAYWCHTSCGGVDLTGPLSREDDPSGRSHRLASNACTARPSPVALDWEVKHE